MRAFERGARRYLGWGLAGAVYRAVIGDDVDRDRAIVKDSPGSTILRLNWDSEDGWLKSLSKSRRGDIRRQARLVDADETTIIKQGMGRKDLDPELLARLNTAHTTRLGARFDPRFPLTASWFERMCVRDDVSVISYHDPDDRLMAFSMLFDHETTPQHGPWAALRPEEGGKKHLYFHQYVLTLRKVIGDGRKELLGGRGMVDVKQSLGFEYIPMRMIAVPRWAMG